MKHGDSMNGVRAGSGQNRKAKGTGQSRTEMTEEQLRSAANVRGTKSPMHCGVSHKA